MPSKTGQSLTEEQVLQMMNEPVERIVQEQLGLSPTDAGYNQAVYKLFDGRDPDRKRIDTPDHWNDAEKERAERIGTSKERSLAQQAAYDTIQENIERVAKARIEILNNPEYRTAIENTGANFTLLGWDRSYGDDIRKVPPEALRIQLVNRTEGSVGAIGGLSERIDEQLFSALTPEAQALLVTASVEGRNPHFNEVLESLLEKKSELFDAYAQSKRSGNAESITSAREAIRAEIASRDPALAAAIMELQERGAYRFRGAPVDLLDALSTPSGFEYLLGGKDDVIIQNGRPARITDIAQVTMHNRIREGHEEVGDIGVDVKRAIDEGRLTEVPTQGVHDDDWLIRVRAQMLGDPRLSNTDYAITPKVAVLKMSAAEQASVEGTKVNENGEVNGMKPHDLIDTLALSAIPAKNGGYQYAHEAYAALQILKEINGGNPEQLALIGKEVQERINVLAAQAGMLYAPRFSVQRLAEAKRITLDQLHRNIGIDEQTFGTLQQAARSVEAPITDNASDRAVIFQNNKDAYRAIDILHSYNEKNLVPDGRGIADTAPRGGSMYPGFGARIVPVNPSDPDGPSYLVIYNSYTESSDQQQALITEALDWNAQLEVSNTYSHPIDSSSVTRPLAYKIGEVPDLQKRTNQIIADSASRSTLPSVDVSEIDFSNAREVVSGSHDRHRLTTRETALLLEGPINRSLVTPRGYPLKDSNSVSAGNESYVVIRQEMQTGVPRYQILTLEQCKDRITLPGGRPVDPETDLPRIRLSTYTERTRASANIRIR